MAMPRAQRDAETCGSAFATREFDYRPRDFARVRELIDAHAGISLNASKTEMVYSRLSKRLRELNLRRFDTYLELLDDPAHSEWEYFVNALTTNLTEFFREAHHYPILARHALAVSSRPVRVWSAACSTGEEPYSLAMTLADAFGTLTPPIAIVASDVDTHVLERAADGAYPAARVADLSPEVRHKYLLRGKGVRTGQVRVRAEIRRLVEFRQINLRDSELGVEGQFDAIFCRNVLIYFDKPTQYRVISQLAARLKPDGLYFAGHSESLLHAAKVLTPIGKTVYRPVGSRATG